MRRRYVLALVLATALIFTLAGIAFGHYVWDDSKGPTALCLRFRHLLNTDSGLSGEAFTYYDEECR